MNVSKINCYGFEGWDLDSVLATIEKLFGCKLEAHESMYKGEYWIYRSAKGMFPKHIEIGFNQDPMYSEDESPEEEYYFDYEFRECNVLLTFSSDPDYADEQNTKLLGLSNVKFISSKYHEWPNA